ncbi:MAG: Nif3-like dinuclear metal center hexameric protein [Candidatus Xiphinematobacter sp.]|nr:MAG: Nif3-like dinuclear metal center hexameric protein [Candidatus Xiphinematobacter sp.]
MVFLRDIIPYLDRLLHIHESGDAPGAHNGLQLENSGKIGRIAAAVDACEAVIERAIRVECTLLLVHHGLFWGENKRWVGVPYRRLRSAISGDLAIYSAHLPLDIHPRHGNNVLLAQTCGFTHYQPFLQVLGTYVGLRVEVRLSRAEVLNRVAGAVCGDVHLAPGGPETCCHIGIISGSAGSMITQAAADGIDTLITGEGAHWTYIAAEESRVNLIYAGHYATETFGIRSVAEHLSEYLSLPWEFIDHPTGR